MPRPGRRGRRLRDPHGGGPRRGRRALAAAGRVPGQGRRAVRVLHPRAADVRPRAARGASASRPGTRSRRGWRATSAAVPATSRSSTRSAPPPRERTDDRLARRRLAQPRRWHRPRHRRPAVPRGPPGRGCAARQAGDPGLRAGTDPGDRRLRGARPARRPPGHDGGRPAHAHAPVRAAEPGPARPRGRRDQVPRRPRGAGRRRHPRPGRGGRPARPGGARGAAGRVHGRGRPRAGCAARAGSLAALRRPARRQQRAHRAPGRLGGRRRRGGRVRTSWWRAATRSRW